MVAMKCKLKGTFFSFRITFPRLLCFFSVRRCLFIFFISFLLAFASAFFSRKIIIQNAPPISKREMLKFLSHILIDDARAYYKKGMALQLR
jgi:hypothetical protein